MTQTQQTTTHTATDTAEPSYGSPAYWAWAGRRYQRHLDATPNEFWVSDGGWDEKRRTCLDPIYYGVPCLPGLSVYVCGVPDHVWEVKAWLETEPRTELDAAVKVKRNEARAREMERIAGHDAAALAEKEIPC